MPFRVLGLDPGPFRHLFGLPDAELARRGVHRLVVDATPGFPDRVEVPAATPFRASHAIFVREGAERALDLVDALPDAIRRRPISLRAFDAGGTMVDAALADGAALLPVIAGFLARLAVAYLHAHYAAPGCYAARIVRA